MRSPTPSCASRCSSPCHIDEASAKVSAGETDDDLDDQALPIWAGTIPARLVFGEPVPDTRGAMSTSDVEVPDVRATVLGGSVIEGLRAQIGCIDAVDEREASSIAMTLDRLTWPGDPFSESENEHHLTASAFVISSRGVILHRHRRLGIWVQPGGHVDAGESPEVACLRETKEETGLDVAHLDPVELFHVDVHPGPNGHTHYDLRYVLRARPEDPHPPEGESPEVFWFGFAAAIERAVADLAPALAKLAASLDNLGVTE